jgi:hypothetical protein
LGFVDMMRMYVQIEWLAKYFFLSVFMLAATYSAASPQSGTPDTAAMVHWKALIPTIHDVLIQSGITCPGNRMNVGIVDAAELIPNGPSYALVDFCPGGAYTDGIIAMQIDQGKPVPARFRNANGEALDVEFARGASVMHTVEVKLMPEKQAIFDIFSDIDEKGKPAKCGVNAYVWSANARVFVLDAQLTSHASHNYCQGLIPISEWAQLPFSDTKSGIAFQYPQGYVLKMGDLGDHDTGLGYLGPIRMEFVASGGVRIVTVEPPADSYLGTDYVNAFFTVSANSRLSKGECQAFSDSLAVQKVSVVKTISGIEFHGTRVGEAGLGHQFGGVYYHGYSRGSCYELAYGLATSGYGAVDGMTKLDEGKVFAILERILGTVTVRRKK